MTKFFLCGCMGMALLLNGPVDSAADCGPDGGTRVWLLNPYSISGGCWDQPYDNWMKKFDYDLNELEEKTWATSAGEPTWDNMHLGMDFDPSSCRFWLFDEGVDKLYAIDAAGGSKYTPFQNIADGTLEYWVGGIQYDWVNASFWIRGEAEYPGAPYPTYGKHVVRYTFANGNFQNKVVTNLDNIAGTFSSEWGSQYDLESDLRPIRVDRLTGDAWVPILDSDFDGTDLMVRIDGESGEITMIINDFEGLASFDIDEQNRILWVAAEEDGEGWVYKYDLAEMPDDVEEVEEGSYWKWDLTSESIHFAGKVLDIAASPHDGSLWSLVFFPGPDPVSCSEYDTYGYYLGNTNLYKFDADCNMELVMVLYDDDCDTRDIREPDYIETDEFDGSCVVLRRTADWSGYDEWEESVWDPGTDWETYCQEHPGWFPYLFDWKMARIPADAGEDFAVNWKSVDVPWGDSPYDSYYYHPRLETAKVPWPVPDDCTVSVNGIETDKDEYCVLEPIFFKGDVGADCGIDSVILHVEGDADLELTYEDNCSTTADIDYLWEEGLPVGTYTYWVEVIPCLGEVVTTEGDPFVFTVIDTPPAASITTVGGGNQFYEGDVVSLLVEAQGGCSGLETVAWEVKKGSVNGPVIEAGDESFSCDPAYEPLPVPLENLTPDSYYCTITATSCSGQSDTDSCFFKVKEPIEAQISIEPDQESYFYTQTVFCTIKAASSDGIESIQYRWIRLAGQGSPYAAVSDWEDAPGLEPGETSYSTDKIAIPGPYVSELLWPSEYFLEAELETLEGEEAEGSSETFTVKIPKYPQVWLRAFYYPGSFPGFKFMLNTGAFVIHGIDTLEVTWTAQKKDGEWVTMPVCTPIQVYGQPFYETTDLVFPVPGQEAITSELKSGPVTFTATANYQQDYNGQAGEVSTSIEVYYGLKQFDEQYVVVTDEYIPAENPSGPFYPKPPDDEDGDDGREGDGRRDDRRDGEGRHSGRESGEREGSDSRGRR